VPPANSPLGGPDEALRVVFAALGQPRRAETIALLLDSQHRGSVVLICSDASEPAQVDRLAEMLLQVATSNPTLGAVVLATSRPGRGIAPSGDDERTFAAMRHDLAEADVELLDWFLVDEDLVASVAELSGACWLWRAEEPL
jgi:DNA repair protein RadC